MNCFVIFIFILGLAALYGAVEVKKVVKPHWFPEDGEIIFACEAANADNDHSITWSISDGNTYLSNMSSDGIRIVNSRIGTNVASKIQFQNSSMFSCTSSTICIELNYVECILLKNGVATDLTRYFDFIVLLDKDRPNVTVSVKRTKIEIGDSIALLCVAHGHLGKHKLDITWSKDGKVLKTVKQTHAGEAIYLTYNITKANGSTGGVYMCRANMTTHPKETFQDNESVSLSVIPKLIASNGTSSYYAIGKTVKVQCDIDGYPLNITWLKKSNGTTQVISDSGRFKIEENGKRLTISTFQAEDATDFYCKNKVENGNEIVQMFTFLKTDGAVEVKKVVKPHWFPEDGEIIFACEAENADNDHSIKWSISDGNTYLSNMSSDGIRIVNSRIGTNVASKIQFQNSSMFSCTSSTICIELNYVECILLKNGVATDLTRYFDFIVLLDKDRPNVTVSVKRTKIEIGDSIALLCVAHGHLGKHKLDITWSKDGKVLKTVKQTHAGEAIYLTYNITKANGSTGGVYMCRANMTTHPKETFQDNESVSLSVIPKLIASNGTSSYYAIGKTVKVQCDIDGYPLNITWLKKSNGTTQVISDSGRFKIEKNGKRLTISNFQAEDATDFYCKNKVENGNEIVQMFTFLKTAKPRLTGPSTKEVKAKKGDTVALKCDITVAPLVINWMVDDRLLNASSDSKYVIASNDVRLLKVLNVDYGDSGSIVCSAKNALDKKGVKQTIILRVKDPSTMVSTDEKPVGMIIGILIAVIVVVVIIIAIVCYCKRKGRRNDEAKQVELNNVTRADGGEDMQSKSLIPVDS